VDFSLEPQNSLKVQVFGFKEGYAGIEVEPGFSRKLKLKPEIKKSASPLRKAL
jgi:hypothetical protein